MYCVRKVTNDLYWVGANDHRLALFENCFPIPRGVSYNSYCLLDEKTVLFDTVDWSACRQLLENLAYVLDGRELDYLLVNHLEPDHAACIEEILLRHPKVKLISNEKAFMLMRQFGFHVDGHECIEVKEGDTFSFGKHTVTFVGDSLASGMGIYATGYPNAPYATYRSIGPEAIVNNTTVTNAVTGATETPIETIVASQPDYVYILVGTNTLVNANSEERLLAYYEQMIDVLREKLNPGVVFYIQAIPGVQEDVVQTRPGLDNARIFSVNNLLANLALRKGCYFVNIREALNNLDGSLIDEYDVGLDGVHVNPAGYQAWADYLATHTAWNSRSIYLGQNPWKILGS